MKVVIVGFKVAEENSVYHAKFKSKIPVTQDDELVFDTLLGERFRMAIKRGAEFVSVRFIRDGST